MIIMYTLSEIDFFIMKLLTKLRMVGLPNIILGYAAVPELLGRYMTAETLIEHTDEMLPQLDIYRQRLAPIAHMFEGRSPMKTAAEEVLSSIKRNI
jgi:lipid A disaccharide synthetase